MMPEEVGNCLRYERKELTEREAGKIGRTGRVGKVLGERLNQNNKFGIWIEACSTALAQGESRHMYESTVQKDIQWHGFSRIIIIITRCVFVRQAESTKNRLQN
jgi:hypothetical protein